MLKELTEQGRTEVRQRAQIENSLAGDIDAYAVEDDNFLYYAKNEGVSKVFHIVKGKFDYAMSIEAWEDFTKLMAEVDDDFFVSGEGKEFRDCFLGRYLSRYKRRKAFIADLEFVIADAKGWLGC